MKTITKKALRSKSVDSVLASLRIEQLVPSESVILAMRACMSGHETTSNAIQLAKQRHVLLRRF